ncbi:MAG: outer membrane beta-barrel protein [Chlorobiota bacterium]
MNKIVIIIILSIIMSMTSLAEEDVLRPEGRVGTTGSSSMDKKFAIGLEGGISYNMFSSDLNWATNRGTPTTANSVYNVFDELNGLSPHFGFFIDYSIDETFGLQLKFLYNALSYSGTESGIVDFIDPELLIYLGTGTAELDYRERLKFLNIDPSLRISVNESLYFLVGPSINLGVGDSELRYIFTENEDFVTYDDNATGDESSKTILLTQQNEESWFGLNLAVGYKFEIDEKISLAPQLTYYYGLTSYENSSLVNDNQQITEEDKILTISNKSFNQIRFSLAVWFDKVF